MKFAIAGTGGTGGIIGTYLALAGHEVAFLARGKHLTALQKNGLLLHTSHRGDILLHPVKACTMEDYQDTPDVLLICVKYYSISDALELARRTAGEKTLIIPILNVFGTGEIMQQQLPGRTVLDGCVYIYGMVSSPGIISQPAPILRLFYGFREQQDQRLYPQAKALKSCLHAAGMEGHFSPNIRRDTLEKFSFVSPLGAAGLYYDAVSGDFKTTGPQRKLFSQLVQEIENLGHAMGISFSTPLVQKNLKLLDAFPPDLHTSMQRDVASKGLSEFDGLVHHVVELGKKFHSPVPYYEQLSSWGKQNNIQ